MPGKNQVYGKDYKILSVMLSPEEHRDCKIKAATFGVSVADVCRLALADESLWRKAQELKVQAK